jgi:hypothetical protein
MFTLAFEASAQALAIGVGGHGGGGHSGGHGSHAASHATSGGHSVASSAHPVAKGIPSPSIWSLFKGRSSSSSPGSTYTCKDQNGNRCQ